MTAASGFEAVRANLRSLLPRRADYAGLSRSWRGDAIAGITVAVVALPLALALGITTGVGAAAGLTTAIVAGLVAALFGGSDIQVSGTSGAMAAVLVPIVNRDGASAVLVVSIMAGALLVAAGAARFGRYLAYIPWPVIVGFTAGVGVIIFLQQVPAALGVAKPRGDNTAAVAWRAVQEATHSWHPAALGLVVLVAAVMLVVPRLHRSAPASLIAVAAATFLAQVAHLDVTLIGHLPKSLPAPSIPSLSPGRMRDLTSAAFAVALLAALESLLSAKVADGLVDGRRHDPDRELFGQGAANLVAPLFGGMPGSGALARTAVNVRSGARTRVAAMTHSLALLLVVYAGASLVGRIPIAALSGVLMVTAVRMIEPHTIRGVVRATRSDAAVLALTAVATVVFDAIMAVEIGVAVAAFLALRHVAQSAAATAERLPLPAGPVTADTEHALLDQHILTYRFDGALFFGAAQRFLAELAAVSNVRVVILRLPDLQVLDTTGAIALGEIVTELERRNVTVLLKGARPEHRRILEAVGVLDRLAHENHVFEDLDAAVAHARIHLGRHAAVPAAV